MGPIEMKHRTYYGARSAQAGYVGKVQGVANDSTFLAIIKLLGKS